MKDGRHPDLVEEARGRLGVVEAHPDFARRAPAHAVRERDDVVVKEHEPVPRGAVLRRLGDRAHEGRLLGSDGAVVTEKTALGTHARVEPDEDARGLGHVTHVRAARVEAEPEGRREGAPPRPLRLGCRARPTAPRKRKHVEVVVAGHHADLVGRHPELGLEQLADRLELALEREVREIAGHDDVVRGPGAHAPQDRGEVAGAVLLVALELEVEQARHALVEEARERDVVLREQVKIRDVGDSHGFDPNTRARSRRDVVRAADADLR